MSKSNSPTSSGQQSNQSNQADKSNANDDFGSARQSRNKNDVRNQSGSSDRASSGWANRNDTYAQDPQPGRPSHKSDSKSNHRASYDDIEDDDSDL